MEIVIPSTTKYSDAWEPFCKLFRKFWPDCQFPLTLITDHKTDYWDGDTIIIGQDHGWCRNFQYGLKGKQLDDIEFVLLMQEDFWLNAPADKVFINKALKMMLDDRSIGCFRLFPCPGPDIPLGDDYGQIDSAAKYRVSCQSAIWRKDHLIDILSRFDTPNRFEIEGTIYVNNNCNNFKYYSVRRSDPNTWPLQYYCSAISRGQWNPQALEFAKLHGITVNTSRRPTAPQ